MATDTPVKSGARRPIAARNSAWAATWSASLARRGVSPNAISVGSVLFGAIAGAALFATQYVHSPWLLATLFVLAILGIQARLICNLLDGMVAVEGGKGSKSGEIFNDFPDRLADPLILIGAGYAASTAPHGIELGYLAALLAVMTAYVRVLGRSIGAAVYFIGPMAKQHRMALLTAGCGLASLASLWRIHPWVLWGSLLLINLGCIVTVIRRLGRIVADLEARP